MGQIVIEVPQNINRSYRVNDSKFGERLISVLENLEKNTKPEKLANVIPPRRNSLKEDLENAFGIWSDRKETAEEIAREIRDKNNGKI